MNTPLPVTIIAGAEGPWRVTRVTTLAGEGLAATPRLAMHEGAAPPPGGAWRLAGVTNSHLRYTAEAERARLAGVQQGLGRPEATRGALIPMSKNAAWWALAQDARRALLEEQSAHIAMGLEYLPAVARRLIHCRDLGGAFDFLTWFEFAPEHEADFDALLRRLRASAEWCYVSREVEVRLARD